MSQQSRDDVFELVSQGKLRELMIYLHGKHVEEITNLISCPTFGAPLLVTACLNGCFDVAYYLLKECNADVEQAGFAITSDAKAMQQASPLYCAAANGHFRLVQLMLYFKACVNSTTEAGVTPLHAACINEHLEIVEYLVGSGAQFEIATKDGVTCLMSACSKGNFEIVKFLLECGACVNRKSDNGHTALNSCCKYGSQAVVRLLLKRGAKFDIEPSGISPLFHAAMTGRASIVEYFEQSSKYTKQQKITALELLGATLFLQNQVDIHGKRPCRKIGLECWRRAVRLREEDPEIPLGRPEIAALVQAYDNESEFRTFLEEGELVHDNHYEFKLQADLIIKRILHPVYPVMAHRILEIGLRFANAGNFDECIRLWKYALGTQQKVLVPFHVVTHNSLLCFQQLFAYMMWEPLAHERGFPDVSFHDLLKIFKMSFKEIKRTMDKSKKRKNDLTSKTQFHSSVDNAVRLVGLLCKLQPNLDVTEDQKLKRTVHKFIRMNPCTTNGWTPLHFACYKHSSTVEDYPYVRVVELFLQVGASPNAVDSGRNSPLHIVGRYLPATKSLFKALLQHGAHLDVCNNERQTPLQLARSRSNLDICPLQHINLQCLSAQAIRKYQIPYSGLAHLKLKLFLDAH